MLNFSKRLLLSDPKDEIYVTCFHFKYSKTMENTAKDSIMFTFVETEGKGVATHSPNWVPFQIFQNEGKYPKLEQSSHFWRLRNMVQQLILQTGAEV